MKIYPCARLPGPPPAAVTWFSIIIAAVAAVPILHLSPRRATSPLAATKVEPGRSLPLTLTGEGGRLSLSWDREAPAIRAGQCGILWIADGGIHRRVILDAGQLRAGKLFYWPVNKDVSFEIKMSEVNDRSRETVSGGGASYLRQHSEGPVRRKRRAERTALRSRLHTVHVSRHHSVESPPIAVSAYEDPRIEPI